MASSAENISSTALKQDVVPDGSGPATVIRPGRAVNRPASDVEGAVAGEATSSTIGLLFSEDGRGDHARLPAGMKLGPFVVESRIGAGGMGAVFRAHDESLDRTVALKVLSPAQASDPSAVKRFQNEARAAARLDHENIARVFSTGIAHGLHYIAFEFIEGKTVRELIREKSVLDPSETVNFMLQIAIALKHTSALGVVHRDIKPSNIIMMPNGRAKLVDWGLARKEQFENQSADLTVSGTTLGTFDYISPEQARDPRQVDVRSDIYSLGCTAYHMLTGSAPYAEGTVLQKLLDHQGKPAPDCREKNPKVPAELARIVRKMMASSPEDRYQTPELLIHDLLSLASESGLRPVHPDGLTWQNAQAGNRRVVSDTMLWWWLGAFIIACTVAIVSDSWIADREYATVARSSDFSRYPQQPFNQLQNNSLLTTKSPEPGESVRFNESPLKISEDFPEPLVSQQGGGIGPSIDTWGKKDFLPLLKSGDSPETQSETGTISLAVGGDVSLDDHAMSPLPPTASESSPEAASPGEIAPFRVLAGNGEFIQATDLETAINTVPDGGIIEYSSRQIEPYFCPVRQLRVLDKSVTLRATTGSKLVLSFDTGKMGTLPRSHDLISIKEGSLTISGVDIQVAVPHAITQQWSLFTINATGKLRCRQCTVTVESEHQTAASIVRLAPSPVLSVESMKNDGTLQESETRIEFENCVVRGAADLIIAETSEPASLEIRQSLLTIDGAVVRYTGDDNISSMPEKWDVRLARVTGIINDGLLQVDLGMTIERQPVDFHVRVDDSILIGLIEQPLVHLTGGKETEELQKMVWWIAEHNVYAGWPHKMVINSPAALDSSPVTLDFTDSASGSSQWSESNPQILNRPAGFSSPPTRSDQWNIQLVQSLLESYRASDASPLDLSNFGPEYSNLPVAPSFPKTEILSR